MNIAQDEDSQVSPVNGWTKQEKFFLLQCLRTFGSHDVEQIEDHIPTKNASEILAAINYYKQKADKHPIFEKKPEDIVINNSIGSKPRVPLACWAKLLTDSLSFEELQTQTVTAVRMIADLENFPMPAFTNNIDFRNIYHEIANAMEGKSLGKNNLTAAIINKCLVETALLSKAYIPNSALKYLINSINLSQQEMNVFPRPTLNHELGVLRHLASQRNYNPLNISEAYLKPALDLNYEEED